MFVLSYMFLCVDYFVNFCYCFVNSVTLISTYVHSMDFIFMWLQRFHDFKQCFLFLWPYYIMWLVLSYIVKLRFLFIRSSNCSISLHFTHFIKFLLGYIYLLNSSLLFLGFHPWLLTLCIVLISNCSPLTDCILHRPLNTVCKKSKDKIVLKI